MPVQERSKLPLLGLLLFLAIAVGCGLSYYYTRVTRDPATPPRQAGGSATLAGTATTGTLPSVGQRERLPAQTPSPPAATETLPSGIGGGETPGQALPGEPIARPFSGETLPGPQEPMEDEPDMAERPAMTTDSPDAPGGKNTPDTIQPSGKTTGETPGETAGETPSTGEHTEVFTGRDTEPVTPPAVAGGTAGKSTSTPSPGGGGAASPGVVLYGKGRPVSADGSVVRGDIPPGQEHGQARVPASGQDSVVGLDLVQDLARFLAANYWPAGTHPMAKTRGISTAGIKWANHRYGGQLRGFSTEHDNPALERQHVLQYVFMPSMLKALYGLYDERFYEAMRAEAGLQKRGESNAPLSAAQTAEMFGIYSGMAKDLAGAVHAYAETPHIRPLVAAYAKAADNASAALVRHSESREYADAITRSEAAESYRQALRERERARETLAAAMRRSGAGRSIDSESLVYTAQWMYRRGENSRAALDALAGILEDCAGRFAGLEREYREAPPGGVLRP